MAETGVPTAQQVERRVQRIVNTVRPWAAVWAARYNGAVYLGGSTLTNPHSRDVDLFVVISDHEFAARFGEELVEREFAENHHYRKRTSIVSAKAIDWDSCRSQRWIDDVAKFSGAVTQKLGENVDLKVVPETWWHDKLYPAPILLAAPSPRWFIYSKHCPDPSKKRRAST